MANGIVQPTFNYVVGENNQHSVNASGSALTAAQCSVCCDWCCPHSCVAFYIARAAGSDINTYTHIHCKKWHPEFTHALTHRVGEDMFDKWPSIKPHWLWFHLWTKYPDNYCDVETRQKWTDAARWLFHVGLQCVHCWLYAGWIIWWASLSSSLFH